MNNFKNLSKIINSEKDSFMEVLKDEKIVDSLMQDLENIREKIMAGKIV